MNTHWTDRLSEYLDEELTPAERAVCDGHLASCETCRAIVEQLRTVVAHARADQDRVPQVDLWPRILHDIQRTAQANRVVDRIVPAEVDASRSTRISFTLPQLALAASLLVAVSAGAAYLAAGRALTPPAVHEDPVQAFAEPLMQATADVERANFADAAFDQAVADLEKILADLRDELNPQTVMVIERNLATIDQAIHEARAALDADPANTFLNSHLADARRKKLELLRRATMIHATSGD